MRCTPRNCCADFDPACKDIMPTLDLVVTKPTVTVTKDSTGKIISETVNADGSVYGFVNGLVKKWYVEWPDGSINVTAGNISRSDFLPGNYSIILTSINNPNCVFVFDFTIPDSKAFQVELYYYNEIYPAGVVPKYPPGSYPLYPSASFPYDYRNNDNKRLKTLYDPDTGLVTKGSVLQQTYVVVASGGTPPYFYKWRDFLDTNFIVPANINVNPPSLQPSNNPPSSRPPKINTPKSIDWANVGLLPKNGNGWITVDVSDSSNPVNTHTIWLYIKQDIFP